MQANQLTGSLMILLAIAWCSTGYAQDGVIGGDFILTDQDERPFQLQQLRGKVVLLFFGYTSCPDICPTVLANLSILLKQLGDDADKVQGIFITIDPERDTPLVLKQYIGYFNKNLIGLTGSQHDIDRVVAKFRVKYQKQASAGGHYTMDHTASLYMIDKTGELSTVVPYGLPAEHLLRVVQQLLQNDVEEMGEQQITRDPGNALLTEGRELVGDLQKRVR